MSTLAVARKDFRDAIRSRALWAVSVLFVLLSLVVAVAYGAFPDQLGIGDPTPTGLAFFLANAIGTFIAITAILIGYKSIAGEREQGSIKLLLSLPHTRRDVVFGKVLGRTAVLAVPVVGALLVGTVVGSALIGQFGVVPTVALLVVAALFTLTYVALVVGLSATTGSTTRASALTIGFFFVFELLWDAVVVVLVFVGNGFVLPNPANFPAWVYPLNQIPPTSAFLTTLTAVTPGAGSGLGGQAGTSVDAFYTSPWIAVVALAVWLIVPLAIGYWRFENADL